MKVLICGSFDPCTTGHLSLIARAAAQYEQVVAAVFVNPAKEGLFSYGERVKFLRLASAPYPNVTVDFSDGMVADYVKREGIGKIVKGFRGADDLAYEREMADYNLRHGGVETVFLPAEAGEETVSSTRVREALAAGAPLSGLVPAAAIEAVRQAYRAKVEKNACAESFTKKKEER